MIEKIISIITINAAAPNTNESKLTPVCGSRRITASLWRLAYTFQPVTSPTRTAVYSRIEYPCTHCNTWLMMVSSIVHPLFAYSLLYNVVGRKAARAIRVTFFYLQRGVFDAELVVQLVADGAKQTVFTRGIRQY